MDKTLLLARIDRAWQVLKASYSGLTESQLLEPDVVGTWSIKDIIAHVTWWEEEALNNLPIILAGRKPPKYSSKYGGIDAFNARMWAEKRNLPLVRVLQQRDKTHRRLIDFVEQLPEEQMADRKRFHHRLRLDTYHHYLEHARAIETWRGKTQPLSSDSPKPSSKRNKRA